jgi:hypothetical protein
LVGPIFGGIGMLFTINNSFGLFMEKERSLDSVLYYGNIRLALGLQLELQHVLFLVLLKDV